MHKVTLFSGQQQTEKQAADLIADVGMILGGTRDPEEGVPTAFAVLLTSDGKVYTYGDNYYGQLAHGDREDKEAPTEVAFFIGKKVTAVSAGAFSTLFLIDGKVYACGYNGYGELGLGEEEDKSIPCIISEFEGKKITKLVSGPSHSFIWLEDDSICAFGNNQVGCLGVGKAECYDTPTKVAALEGCTVDQIAVGKNHSIFVTKGKAFFAGYGGECLGLNDEGNIELPTELKLNAAVTAAVIGIRHTLLLTTDGKVKVAGYYCTTGQLGLGDVYDTMAPIDLDIDGKRVKAIAAGWDHSIFLTEDGDVYTCGAGQYGCLGHGDEANKYIPTKITGFDNKKVIAIGAGPTGSVFRTEDGKIYTCGNIINPSDSDHNQLSPTPVSIPTVFVNDDFHQKLKC